MRVWSGSGEITATMLAPGAVAWAISRSLEDSTSHPLTTALSALDAASGVPYGWLVWNDGARARWNSALHSVGSVVEVGASTSNPA